MVKTGLGVNALVPVGVLYKRAHLSSSSSRIVLKRKKRIRARIVQAWSAFTHLTHCFCLYWSIFQNPCGFRRFDNIDTSAARLHLQTRQPTRPSIDCSSRHN